MSWRHFAIAAAYVGEFVLSVALLPFDLAAIANEKRCNLKAKRRRA